MAMIDIRTFTVQRVHELKQKSMEQNWLIESIWTNNSVGILGGAPKCCKSWFGLDMAVSVASSTPCLDCFSVKSSGPVLIYMAEDALTDVRKRIQALCNHRKIEIKQLDLFVITSPSLRLDLEDHQKRLEATLSAFKPRLLLLDPLIRLHRLDENSSGDISLLLGFLRELQRQYNMSIVLVHHASKRHHAQPGQSLRGSSDLHAFGDSNAYLTRRKNVIVLTLEHRMAQPLDPLDIKLVTGKDNSSIHLEIISDHTDFAELSLNNRIITCLNQHNEPLRRLTLRNILKVNNKKLGDTLIEMEKQRQIIRLPKGWTIVKEQEKESFQLCI